MTKRRNGSGGTVKTAARAVALPFRLKSWISDAVRPTARVLGVLGLALLAGCAVLAWMPPESWPAPLEPPLLPVYVMISLVTASLLGWTFVSDGQARIARWMPKIVAAVLFVLMP